MARIYTDEEGEGGITAKRRGRSQRTSTNSAFDTTRGGGYTAYPMEIVL